jgi:mono/diheme cytochrome c family protein
MTKTRLTSLPILFGILFGSACSEETNSASNKPSESAVSSRNKTLLAMTEDKAIVAKGRENYTIFCQACHGPEGQSIDSPSNLFDEKWVHGSSPMKIEKMIHEGYLDGGMPGWGPMIPATDIEALTAYLLTFQKAKETTP